MEWDGMAHPSSRACVLMCVPVCARVRVRVLVCVRGEGSPRPADASACAGKRAGLHMQWLEVRAVLCESLCECACECACGKVCGLACAEQRRVLIPHASGVKRHPLQVGIGGVDGRSLRHVVVWASRRGWASRTPKNTGLDYWNTVNKQTNKQTKTGLGGPRGCSALDQKARGRNGIAHALHRQTDEHADRKPQPHLLFHLTPHEKIRPRPTRGKFFEPAFCFSVATGAAFNLLLQNPRPLFDVDRLCLWPFWQASRQPLGVEGLSLTE